MKVILKRVAEKNPLSKRMTILVLVLLVVFGGLVAYNIIRSMMIARFFANMPQSFVTVSSVEAKAENWQSVLPAVGSFSSIQGIQINAQIGGVVSEIDFESGQDVKKGDVLLVINDSVEQAVLKNNIAGLILQQLNFQRQMSLIKTGSTSTSNRDQARANLDSAMASVEQERAYIAQKHIVAPFDGRLGIRQVSLGQYIVPGQTNIVSLQSLDPLYLQFYLPEQYLTQLSLGQSIEFMVESLPKKTFKANITALDAQVDSETHNLLVQATVHNVKGKDNQWAFLPGIFAKINVLMAKKSNVIVVPLTAVSYTLYGDSVYIIKKEKDKTGKPQLMAYRQYVKTGEKRGNKVIILSGLKAGDVVVNAGQIKLHDGTPVVINNKIVLQEEQSLDTLGQ